MADILKEAHSKSSAHRADIEASELCGCFYCKTVFASNLITEWVNTRRNPERAAALCPNCGINSVIGDASGYNLTPEFLNAMHERWFETTVRIPRSRDA